MSDLVGVLDTNQCVRRDYFKNYKNIKLGKKKKTVITEICRD